MKKVFTTLVAALVLLTFASMAFAIDNGPESMEINAQTTVPDVIKDKDKKQVKNFPHKQHQDGIKGLQKYSQFKYEDDWTCGACHHTSKKGEQPTACMKCKEVNKMIEKVGGEKKWNNIYHQSCKDACHKKAEKAKEKKAGPTKCNDCHKRK